jgi:hypothetical protein
MPVETNLNSVYLSIHLPLFFFLYSKGSKSKDSGAYSSHSRRLNESMARHLLSKTEIALLSGPREFTKSQVRCIRCRLNKKVKDFVDNELPILIDKGLLPEKIVMGRGGFERTSPAENERPSLDMAGVKGSTPFRPTILFYHSLMNTNVRRHYPNQARPHGRTAASEFCNAASKNCNGLDPKYWEEFKAFLLQRMNEASAQET